MLSRVFLAHPRSVGESYLKHMGVALSFGWRLVLAGLACLVHAFIPCLFERTASGMIERLHARTHGWAAGFILLMQDQQARSSAVSAPDADTPSVIFDYLAEEVLQRFKPATQEALLRLAYLPQITLSMADQLGISVESRNTLLAFAQSGFLVTVIPTEPQKIYQLHPLLRWDSKTEFVQAIKLSMDMLGRKGGPTRPPRQPLTTEQETAVRAATQAARDAGLK